MSEKKISETLKDIEFLKVVKGLDACKLSVSDGKFVIECPEAVIVEATKAITKDGILIKQVKLKTD